MTNTYGRKPSFHAQCVPVRIADISTAGQEHISPGFKGKIRQATNSLGGEITGADATLTLKIVSGGTATAVTNGTITVANSSSAAGDVASCTPTGNNTFSQTDSIEVETNGNSTNTVPTTVLLELEPI